MKRSKLFGIITDFCLFMVLFSLIELLFRNGLKFSEWNLASTRLAYNASLAAAMAFVFYLKGASR